MPFVCGLMVGFFADDVQKSDDIKISRQFKESVIRPILKVTSLHENIESFNLGLKRIYVIGFFFFCLP